MAVAWLLEPQYGERGVQPTQACINGQDLGAMPTL